VVLLKESFARGCKEDGQQETSLFLVHGSRRRIVVVKQDVVELLRKCRE